jgi:hypothetical protein
MSFSMRMGMGLGAAMQRAAVGTLPTEDGILYNGYMYHIFEADGELEVLADVDVEYLIVGGGGAGSAYGGGSGGGAGGLLTNEGGTPLTLTGGTTYYIDIGAGGAGVFNTARGAAGQNTTLSIKDGATLLTAIGGGGGGRWDNVSGGSGGSGGGAAALSGGVARQTIPATEGYDAGYGSNGGTSGNKAIGSGGGGASGVPINPANGDIGNQPGSAGKQVFAGFKITSRSAEEYGDWYAGGGGGYQRSDGGKGGGGASIYDTVTPTPGISGVNGSGGGGGACANATPGSGGSGLVIVRYPI